MSIFYDSEIDNIEQDWSAARNQPAPQEKTGHLKAAGMGVMRGGVALAKGAALLGSTLFPEETAARDDSRIIPRKEDFIRFINGPLDEAEKFFTPDPQSVGLSGQIIGAVSELPLQLAAGPMNMIMSATANTGMKLVEQGVDARTAGVAAAGAGAVNALMIKLPQAGRNLLETGGLALLNPLLGAGQDLALKTGLEAQGYKEQAAAIDPLNPVSRTVDLTLGGVFGALGYRANRINAIAKSTAFEHVATRAEEYYNLVEKIGGDEGLRERLPVEVVDSLDTTRSYLKTLESNPFDRKALEGVDRHLAALNKSLADVTEGRPVDVAAHVKDLVEPAPRTLDFQTFMDKHSARLGLTPEQEAAHAGLIAARAKRMGMDVDEFVGKYFADVTNERPGEGALLQTGSAAELLQQRHAAQTPAEQQRAMYIDEHSGVYNARAFNAAPDTGNVAVFGFDSLKFINDTVNHQLGNEAYRVAGQALKRAGDELGIPIYRVRGDYAAHLPEGEAGQAQFEQLLQRANELRDTLDFPKVEAAGVQGGAYDAIQLRGAMGKDVDSAHEAFTAHKVELENAGLRPARETMPRGMDSGTTTERKTAHAEYGVTEEQAQHFDSLSEAERFAAVHIDPATGLYSHAAFQALESVHNWKNDRNHGVASIDVAGLGALDRLNSTAADELLLVFSRALREVSGDTLDAFRMAERGDEFALRGSYEQVQKALKELEKKLETAKIDVTVSDGTTVQYPVKFWHQTGGSYENADSALSILKGYEKRLTERNQYEGRHGGLLEQFAAWIKDSGNIGRRQTSGSSLVDFIRQDAVARGLDPQPHLDKIPAGTLAELDASASAVLYQSRPVAEPFYSALQRSVEGLSQEKWQGDQLLATIRKTPGIKPEEITWTGLDEFLAGKKSVTREEVRAYLQENQVQVREVHKADRDVYDSELDPYEQKIANMDKAKYGSYVTPGGENYRELLLTLPDNPGNYHSSHFDEPNLLAHVRFNERTGPDGERILHVEEVQSDWHQSRRDGKAVPDAPFAKTWHELTLRRMLRYAAENNFDRLTWTTGEQQADRYDISKKMDSVSYRQEGDQYIVSGVDVHGQEHALGTFAEKQLPDAVGKELSQKITGGEGVPNGQWTKLAGLDLKVGGTGMKGFYDKIIPDFMRSFGKKFDATVEDTNIGTDTENAWQVVDTKRGTIVAEFQERSQAENFKGTGAASEHLSVEPVQTGNNIAVHSIPITEAMRDSLLYEGQPLFQDAKGAVSFLADGRAVIHALENPDVSTAVHELAHVFARTLDSQERFHFDQWLLNYSRGKKGEWSVADHEAFARAFEKYLSEGQAPTPELQTFFNNFKTWLVEIYRNIMGSPLEMRLHPEVKKAFDRMLVSETLRREVAPEVQALRDSASAHLPEITADLHDLAGVPLPDADHITGVSKKVEPPPTPARIQRDIALQLYDDPELITRFVSDPKNIAGVLAQSLEVEAGQLAGIKPKSAPSLTEYLRKLGINDDRGDLASMDIDKGLKPGTRKLLRPDGVGLDKARESAMEQGYLPEGATTADLLNLIDQEMRGNPVYPVSGDMSTSIPEWFQSILNINRRTGKGTDTAEVAAAALRKAAAGGFNKLPAKQQDIVLAALDSINRQVQSTRREIDAQELHVGDRFMNPDLSYNTVVAERNGKLVLDNGKTVAIDSTMRVLGEVDQTGRPPEKGYDPLDYDVEHLLKERGDFQLSNGRDAAGNEIMVSAREFIDAAKNDAAAHDNRKHLYDLAAACMAPEF